MIEQRFLQLKKTLTQEEFDSVEFLKNKAEQLEKTDPQLSKRVLVRINNLTKEKQRKQAANGKLSVASMNVADKPETSEEPIVMKSGGKKDKPIKNSSDNKFKKFFRASFFLYILLPTILFSLYQCFWATERFESQAQVIVQQPDSVSTMDASMALLSGLGVSTSISDTEIVKAYIYSSDMLNYLNDTLNLREHFSTESADYFSRISDTDSRERMLEFYKKHVEVYIEEKSGVISIYTQAFTPDFAKKIAETIVLRAEWYINSIGHQLAEAQLNFIKGEHQNIENKLADAQGRLLKFQQQYNLLDPTAEGLAMQKITYTLEGQISEKETELKALQSIMSKSAPQVIALEAELNAIRSQLRSERSKLSQEKEGEVIPVSEILTKYTDFKIKMELALQSYTASQVSLEKSRIEAYRQMKYLVIVESATLPQDAKYPNAIYNITLFFVVFSMIFVIGKIIISTIRELR